MIRINKIIGEGRDAFIAHRFSGQELVNPYPRGRKGHFYWSRGVELARIKVGELLRIGG
jgi:hypothetical protein